MSEHELTDTSTTAEPKPLDVNSILQSAPQFKPVTVDKDDDLTYDLGRLCAFDYHPINSHELPSLKDLTRDNVQLLFTKIFQLPTRVVTDGVLAELPTPTTILPRCKPLPEAKPPTRWEKFAKAKGIPKKARKPSLVWDEEHQEYRRRFGYKRANDPEDQVVVAHDEKDQSGMDPFTKMKADKKKRLDKQASQEKRNKDEANFDKARVRATRGAKMKDDISRTFALVSRSTASLGRFDRRLPGEKAAPAVKGTRKNAGVGAATSSTLGGEKSSTLTLLDKMFQKEDKKGQINRDRAASQFIASEQRGAKRKNEEALLSGKPFKKSKGNGNGKGKGNGNGNRKGKGKGKGK